MSAILVISCHGGPCCCSQTSHLGRTIGSFTSCIGWQLAQTASSDLVKARLQAGSFQVSSYSVPPSFMFEMYGVISDRVLLSSSPGLVLRQSRPIRELWYTGRSSVLKPALSSALCVGQTGTKLDRGGAREGGWEGKGKAPT